MMSGAAEWSAKRILVELCEPPKRREVLSAFWSGTDEIHRRIATVHLAKSLHFREETIRKSPAAKRSEWLATRINAPEFEEVFEAALMVYHTHHAKELMSAFLEEWGIPNSDGTIEAEEYKTPTAEDAERALMKLGERFSLRDILVYFASAGLLMGGDWRAATWPVVNAYREKAVAQS
jgi:hypothetical protein